MTDGIDTDGFPHLSDEHLSWYVDGSPVVPGAAAVEPGRIAAHVAGCEPCRRRLQSLQRARAIVRTPVPPVAPAVRADAVSAVLRSWAAAGEPDSRAARPQGADGGGLPSIAALRLRRRRPGFIGAAAAVAVLLVVGVGVLVANVVPSSTSSTANRAASAPASTTVPAFSNAPSAPGPAAGASAGATTQPFATYGQAELGGASAPLAQLGSVSSVGALRSTVSRVLSGSSALALGSTATTAPAPASALSQGASGPDHNAATPPASGPATTVTAPPSGGASGGVTQDASLPGALRSCLSSARRATGGARRVELAGSAVYRGTPALVYVLSPAAAASASSSPSASSTGGSTFSKGDTIVVVARHGCGLLASTTL